MVPPTTASGPSPNEVTLQVRGMHCAGCVSNVDRALRQVPGVQEVQVNLASGRTLVRTSHPVPPQRLIQGVEQAGFQAELPGPTLRQSAVDSERQIRTDVGRWWLRFLLGLALLGGLLILSAIEYIWSIGLLGPQTVLAAVLIAYVGGPYYAAAARQAVRGRANMDTLIAVGSLVAFAYGLYLARAYGMGLMRYIDAGMILVVVTFGRFLETRAKAKSSRAVRELMTLAPDVALVLRDGQTATVPIQEVAPGATILIRVGDRIPLDGVVTKGFTQVDASWLTGEPHRVPKQVGDSIHAGTLNETGVIEAEVTADAADTSLARVVALVERAQSSKAAVQRLADRVAAWFVPAVLLVAISVLTTWWLTTGDWEIAIRCAVAVTIVSCPCAFGLATPTAIMAACEASAKRGVFVKNATAFETANRLSSILFDKTGTITRGTPSVTEVQTITSAGSGLVPTAANGELPDWLLAAAAVEQSSSHPLALAIVEYVRSISDLQGVRTLPVVDHPQTFAGEGMSATVAGAEFLVGSETFLQRHAIVPRSAKGTRSQQGVDTRQIVLVAWRGAHVGTIVIETEVDPHIKEVIKDLRKLGLMTAIVTGDREESARQIGQLAGIDQVDSRATPEDKFDKIAKLQKSGHAVAMVGDGINDAAALASADLGIAIGSGADVAIESADVVLVEPDLRRIVYVVRLARQTLRTIKQNIGWALIYNLLLIPVAGGILVPWGGPELPATLAAAAMTLSSLSVVTNSLRLTRFR